uniref:Rab-GAP TBC domain-containing protein n=1 Tax=Meloidogyne javanica TaxID=6303 RepID=A0A915MD97_MELJA
MSSNEDQTTLLTPISNALSLSLAKKCSKISDIVKENNNCLDVHLQHFCGFAISSGGLISDDFRKKIWPVLAKNIPLAKRCNSTSREHFEIVEFKCNNNSDKANTSNISDSDFESALSTFSDSSEEEDDDDITLDNCVASSSQPLEIQIEELQSHPDWKQVELDVIRTLSRFPPDIEDVERERLQQQLTPLIVRILYQNEDFHYYQGFHDVCLTFLLILDADEAFKAVQSICQRGSFGNYLSCSLEESVLKELDDIYVLLFLHDREVEEQLRGLELGTLFALSWPLTWFSHALQHHSQVTLFFDFFLCSDYLMPIYVSAALICERREEILNCEKEMPLMHKLLNHVPAEINCNRIVSTARSLYGSYPPTVLHEYKKEYDKIRERQRRQKDIMEKIDNVNRENMQMLLERRGSSLRLNVYEFARPFAVFGGVAAIAVVYFYTKNGFPIF